MTNSDLMATDDHGEALAELRNVLKRMLIDDLLAREKQALEALQTDLSPQAQQNYRDLQTRRKAMESGSTATS
jgi:hypothetical protein